MTNFKGTKGKWYVPNLIPYKVNSNGSEICKASITNEYYKANALLISKAPEMLEMLEIIYQQIDFSFEAWGSDSGLKMEAGLKQLIKEATTV